MKEFNIADKCLFCRKPKTWNSEIWLISKTSNIIFKTTICEKCRRDPKRTLFKLYKEIGKKYKARRHEKTDD